METVCRAFALPCSIACVPVVPARADNHAYSHTHTHAQPSPLSHTCSAGNARADVSDRSARATSGLTVVCETHAHERSSCDKRVLIDDIESIDAANRAVTRTHARAHSHGGAPGHGSAHGQDDSSNGQCGTQPGAQGATDDAAAPRPSSPLSATAAVLGQLSCSPTASSGAHPPLQILHIGHARVSERARVCVCVGACVCARETARAVSSLLACVAAVLDEALVQNGSASSPQRIRALQDLLVRACVTDTGAFPDAHTHSYAHTHGIAGIQGVLRALALGVRTPAPPDTPPYAAAADRAIAMTASLLPLCDCDKAALARLHAHTASRPRVHAVKAAWVARNLRPGMFRIELGHLENVLQLLVQIAAAGSGSPSPRMARMNVSVQTGDDGKRVWIVRTPAGGASQHSGAGRGTDEMVRRTPRGARGPDDAEADAGDGDDDIPRLVRAITRALPHMPARTREHVQRELRRLQRMHAMQPEYSMLRTWCEFVRDLPWASAIPSEQPPPRALIASARRILDEDHHGLQAVKQRIIEYLAVRALRGSESVAGPILCLVGPPGVGKTSLGASLARALGRAYVRVALGGVRDEADVRGHRRTYVGALPGRILTALRTAKTIDPVCVLDEVDKLSRDSMRGDPTAALLEALDPEQNKEFVDHYLGVPYDLSRVIWVLTANTLETMPAPLLDRLEIVQLPGYTAAEKLVIAQRFLVPRQLERNGLQRGSIEFSDAGLSCIIDEYTREAGVRGLERCLASVSRKVALSAVEGSAPGSVSDNAMHRLIDREDVYELLGAPKYATASWETVPDADSGETGAAGSMPGVFMGLAWTTVGGETMRIETAVLPGTGELILTGQLGEVMRESVTTAVSLLRRMAANGCIALAPEFAGGAWRSRLRRRHAGEEHRRPAAPPKPEVNGADEDSDYEAEEEHTAHSRDVQAARAPRRQRPGSHVHARDPSRTLLAGLDLHVHFPAAAVPKDGPSAGVAVLVALVSLATGVPPRSDTAATGEITLTGCIGAIGGVRDKVLAAERAGLRRVLLPADNAPDAAELPASTLERLEIVLVNDAESALAAAFPPAAWARMFHRLPSDSDAGASSPDHASGLLDPAMLMRLGSLGLGWGDRDRVITGTPKL